MIENEYFMGMIQIFLMFYFFYFSFKNNVINIILNNERFDVGYFKLSMIILFLFFILYTFVIVLNLYNNYNLNNKNNYKKNKNDLKINKIIGTIIPFLLILFISGIVFLFQSFNYINEMKLFTKIKYIIIFISLLIISFFNYTHFILNIIINTIFLYLTFKGLFSKQKGFIVF
jgi:hypothetical protein